MFPRAASWEATHRAGPLSLARPAGGVYFFCEARDRYFVGSTARRFQVEQKMELNLDHLEDQRC